MHGDKADAMIDRLLAGLEQRKKLEVPEAADVRLALLSRLHQRCSGWLFSGAEAFLDKRLRAGLGYEIEAWSER